VNTRGLVDLSPLVSIEPDAQAHHHRSDPDSARVNAPQVARERCVASRSPTGAKDPLKPDEYGLIVLNKPDGYLLGSDRIAPAPEPNSSRLTSFKSTCFDSPANNVGPWPASLGCTTNSYSSINPSSVNASGSFTPPTNSPLPDSRLSC